MTEKIFRNAWYPAIFIAIVFIVLTGGCVTDTSASSSTGIPAVTPTLPPGHPPLSTVTATEYTPEPSAVPPPVFTPDPITGCTMDPHVPVPVDTSIPVRDPMPGIRYSINESESGRTVVLQKGDIVEINLQFNPGLAFHWVVPVYGCALELTNDGSFSNGRDFWNVTAYYRARYRAVRDGTSVISGRRILSAEREGDPRFDLTVIVK
jgi:hypothetical protein